jgi:hypothetical protein
MSEPRVAALVCAGPDRRTDPTRRAPKRKSDLDGKPWKELYRYKNFAPTVANQLRRVRQACSEADRMLRLVEQRRKQLDAEG